MIGVAISTHARPHTLSRALQQWALHMPDILVVTHDVDGQGVAATKNRGITALMDAGCTHLFLADDDTWPITPEWATPYTTDPEPHLMHCWGRSRLLTDDGHHTTWSHPRGVMLYTERHVIDRVGGMRTEFGRWGGEHVEWSRRIHNTGLTTSRYTDLTAARTGIWHCEDYTRATASTVNAEERETLAPLRHELYKRYRESTDFVEYRSA